MTQHTPVLLTETVELLRRGKGNVFIDGTFGGGGHTSALLNSHSQYEVWAIDCDPAAIVRSEKVQKAYPDRFHFRSANFRDLHTLPVDNVAGALFDLGVSSFQLDTAERGFSFSQPGPIDMRLNPSAGRSAQEFLEHAPEKALIEAIRDFGEEPHWRFVVRAIISARGTPQLGDTGALAQLIAKTIGHRHRGHIHPATRSFQGIRIAINDELGALTDVLPAAFEKLAPEGVLAVISFHSLEDRIVKRAFNRLAGRPEHREDSTSQQERQAVATLLTKKPITPSEAELEVNPRARSAKLRAIQKN